MLLTNDFLFKFLKENQFKEYASINRQQTERMSFQISQNLKMDLNPLVQFLS